MDEHFSRVHQLIHALVMVMQWSLELVCLARIWNLFSFILQVCHCYIEHPGFKW